MADNQSNTYTPLEGRRPIDSPEAEQLPPRDEHRFVFNAFIMAGIGFVLPYNSFTIASDFWQTRFPGRSVALDMSMTYIVVAFATVLLNNVFLSLFTFRVRILFGYFISLSTFLFVSICEVAIEMFSMQTAYGINLVAVALTAIGCTVQQSSFYGFASMFPNQYTHAVMTGESAAGFLVSLTRIITKLTISSDRASTFIFLMLSVVYIASSYICHANTIYTPFVKYYTEQCSRIVLRPDEERSDGDHSNATKYGIVSRTGSAGNSPLPGAVQITSQSASGLSFSNPVYELSNPSAGESSLDVLNETDATKTARSSSIGSIGEAGLETGDAMDARYRSRQTFVTSAAVDGPQTPSVAYKVEHILQPGGCSSSRFSDLKSGLEARWRVAHAIYPYMVSIALAYCVTLSLYPGIETEIISCKLKSWMPVLLMFTFNLSDLIGKIIATIPYNWTRRQLILLSGMRTGLIPLLLLCCAPRTQPVIAGEASAFVFSAALGITNGMAGSLPMMLAPAKVPASLKEVTGNMMTLSYNVGLTAGSLIGYVFESMLGPQLINPCPSYPYIPMGPTTTTSTTTAATTTAAAAALVNVTTSVATTALAAWTASSSAAVPTLATTTAAAMLNSTTVATVLSTIGSSVAAAASSIPSSTVEALSTTTARHLATTAYNMTDMMIHMRAH